MTPLSSISLEAIRAARGRIADLAVRTPLIRLHLEDAPAEIHLKLENQPRRHRRCSRHRKARGYSSWR